MPAESQTSKSIPRVWIIALVLFAVSLIAASFIADAPVRAAILEAQGKGWKKTSEYAFQAAISKYGDWPQLMIVGIIGLAIARALKRKDWQRVIVAALIASTLAGMVANMSRLTTGRTRPRESPKIEAGWYGPIHNGEILIGNSKYNAFPSGHTATAVGFAAPFLFAKPIAGGVLMIFALMVAWSRMALGAHNLSDVVVSILLATAIGWFVYRRIETHGAAYGSRVFTLYQSWRQRRRNKND